MSSLIWSQASSFFRIPATATSLENSLACLPLTESSHENFALFVKIQLVQSCINL